MVYGLHSYLHNEDIGINVHYIVHFPALRYQLLQEGVAGGPVIEIVVSISARSELSQTPTYAPTPGLLYLPEGGRFNQLT
jgi:hypothetical protein